MITLVTGGAKCGKSSYAEKVLENFEGEKYYVATMNPMGDDAKEIIARHIKMRRDKDFVTVECLRDIGNADVPEGCAVLIECMGNLCANEMFIGPNVHKPAEKIVEGIRRLSERTAELVIVTNEVGCDGISYSADTKAYISQLSEINCKIAEFADNVVECVYGIPVVRKGSLIC
ncbi:MAG: bifunctional adenosylcobinamide kinase/adenosylcobinamide-phosphate guanylyltransferase [Ruminococcus sp.]|uniref:bifunctional adenosylcobinamide kinase/adenosylcobinamide-phosphate guanylyltransferase n=1 Tax=Ruminococcus sp. TaxID=41978 RepID=UPI0025D62F37|nr:bifunctional adenosylcobinamide kinase/adenosylcobinamide-phosphate guanylyltransferase [Ruminococcus sp.]MCR5600914.1 bifunctional adenosylcobinamide kinase/adenosylcobinamide-phosphate guanylyltransferase [Ruminococcus sp.]